MSHEHRPYVTALGSPASIATGSCAGWTIFRLSSDPAEIDIPTPIPNSSTGPCVQANRAAGSPMRHAMRLQRNFALHVCRRARVTYNDKPAELNEKEPSLSHLLPLGIFTRKR